MKRILMMLALTALLVAALSMSAFSASADPDCEQVPGNPNCVNVNKKSGQESNCQSKKNCGDVFKPGR